MKAPTVMDRTPSLSLTQLHRPAFLLNPPLSYATTVANNVWMEEIDVTEREPDRRKAMRQFLQLYRHLASEALVYLLPMPRDCQLQDLVFTANLGVVLEHLPDTPTVVLSNFTSEPRRGETAIGLRFFEAMGYDAVVAPHKFEGEAELKHLHDNVYVGGYGLRSERETFEWMQQTFDMKVILLRQADPYLYHLDCSIFPLTTENTMVCTQLYAKSEVRALERYTNIIDVSVDDCYSGICNSVRLSNTLLNASHLHQLQGGTEEYKRELQKNCALEYIASNLALEVVYFNLSEYHKGGALLSCMVMNLNRWSYAFKLL